MRKCQDIGRGANAKPRVGSILIAHNHDLICISNFKQSYQILDGHTIFSFVGNLFFSNESWIMTHDSQYLGIAPVLAKTLSIRKDKPRPSRRAKNNRIFRTTAKREGTRLAYRVVLYHFYSFPITVSTKNTLMCKFIKLKECFSDVVPCFPIRVYRKGAF